MTSVTDIDLEIIRAQWLEEASESELGLWWLADDLREVLGDSATEDEVRAATLEAVKPLLESGKLLAVDFLKGGITKPWSGEIDQQLERIAEDWKSVGKPEIGDVVWFTGP